MLIAGEISGDLLGAHLIAALKLRLLGRLEVVGVGGERMAAQGLKSFFPMQDLSLVGIVEVLPHLPKLIRRLRQTAALCAAYRPDAVVTIDSPGFNFRLARRIRGLGIPLIHYVAPQVWAWRPNRVKTVAALYDHMLSLLPFEPPWFEKAGLPTAFVGHPVLEAGIERGDGAAFRRRHKLPAEERLLMLLPGSRPSEIGRHLPIFAEAFRRLRRRQSDLNAVVATAPMLVEQIAAEMARLELPAIVVAGEERFDAFAAAHGALAASGTVTLELALAGLPSVIAYRLNPLSGWLARRWIRVPHVALANILADQPVMPEYLQENCRPDLLADALEKLFNDPKAEETFAALRSTIAAKLGAGGEPPSLRAADAILRAIDLGPRKRGAIRSAD
jgi:lipid-A-disaccharide synthase